MKHSPRWGAFPEDWQRLIDLGLGADLLPVVSNPGAKISLRSSMKALGKTPSMYNGHREAVGIPQWTQHQASDQELRRWMAEPDYGIAVQTRDAPLFDIDVSNKAVADAIEHAIQYHLSGEYDIQLPVRRRRDSAKRALWFRLSGAMPKRIMHVEGGIVELLGAGQQFIAFGTHPSGARYEWNSLREHLDPPDLTLEQVDGIWRMLTEQFAVEPPREMKHTERKRGPQMDIPDPVADWLEGQGLALEEDGRGAIMVECPWQDEHSSGEAGDSSTVWFRAGTNGHTTGHFKCLHAHCAGRTRSDYLAAVGYEDDVSGDFEDLGPDTGGSEEGEGALGPADASSPDPFEVIPAHIFAAQPAGEYIIDDVIPEADIGMIYGPSGDGKSFVMIDMCMAIARGLPWRGKKVKQGSIVYIVAEGGGGFRKRLNAYAIHNGINLADVPFGVIHAAPNLLDAAQVKRICASILKNGAKVIVVDTFAQTTPGSNENAGEDVGKAIANIRGVGRKVGAMVILVHHTGKDASRGARGWSGLRAAADFELEIVRDGENRMINTTKQKDGDDGERWGFKLLEVAIGMRDDGKVITSCVIVENDVQVAGGVKGGGRAAKPAKQMGDWEQALLDVYSELALGGDVLKSELIIRTADRRPDAGSQRDRRKNVKHALRRLSRGDNGTFISGEDDDYVSLRT